MGTLYVLLEPERASLLQPGEVGLVARGRVVLEVRQAAQVALLDVGDVYLRGKLIHAEFRVVLTLRSRIVACR
jgi:hypothetical protein